MTFLDQFQKHISKNKFFKKKERLLIACSGGGDSVALFFLILEISKNTSWEIGLTHFHHGLRKSADKDRDFVKALAKKYKVRFFGGSGNVSRVAKKEKKSLEECARHMRYDFFEKVYDQYKASKILFAHHMEDQAETILMRILQGTGSRGLLGIREKVKIGGMNVLRPLLEFNKEDLKDYLKSKKIKYRYDPSNHSIKHLRNKLRRKVLPFLVEEVNPRAVEAIARLPKSIKLEQDVLIEIEEKGWGQVVLKKTKSKMTLSQSQFLKLQPAIQFRILIRALKSVDSMSGLLFSHWGELSENITLKRYNCHLPQAMELKIEKGQMIIQKIRAKK